MTKNAMMIMYFQWKRMKKEEDDDDDDQMKKKMKRSNAKHKCSTFFFIKDHRIK